MNKIEREDHSQTVRINEDDQRQAEPEKTIETRENKPKTKQSKRGTEEDGQNSMIKDEKLEEMRKQQMEKTQMIAQMNKEYQSKAAAFKIEQAEIAAEAKRKA